MNAAGVLEAVATILQIQHGFVHPNPALQAPLDRGVRLVGRHSEAASIDVALSNSFGFGGFNTSIVFQRSRAGCIPVE
jgi:malonyl-ACP decarboxylase